ncbi:methyltransferase domain-containing protein [Kitasatospora sp. NPDC048540]|uniref:methyltransferase domain-containing protein n=1 Tax=Kitasatospora sp. NPDC048540 TaxID=3155634 RepID=UPI0033CAAA25
MTVTGSGARTGPEGLVRALVTDGTLTEDWVPAFRAVPREAFVPDVVWPGTASGARQDPAVDRRTDPTAWRDAVYRDVPLTFQWDDGAHQGPSQGTVPSSSVSMPHMVAGMLADLDVADGIRVLDIGTGAGWNAGLLTWRLGDEHVVTVEVDPYLAQAARQRLAAQGLHPHCVTGDGAAGHPGGAPYDRVIATFSVTDVPAAWLEQTVPGGLIVVPWGTEYGGEAVARLTVTPGGTAEGRFTRSSAFMRMRSQRGVRPPFDAYLHGRPWPADGRRSTTTLSPAHTGGWIEQFVIGLQVPRAFWRSERYDDGTYTLWLHDPTDTRCWASADWEPGRARYDVVQAGPRSLWDEVEAAWRWWDARGRPGFTRFGLTVDATGQHPWLDTPDHPLDMPRSF